MTMSRSTKHLRASLLTLLLAAAVPVLQGCFPVAAAGLAAGAITFSDRRSVASQAVDQEIEGQAGSRIDARLGPDAHVNVTAYNRVVLLTGEVPNDAAKAQAEAIAKELAFTQVVVNELRIGPPSSKAARADDAGLTLKVKARLASHEGISPNHVKVVTEAGTVHLMGLLTEAEGKLAVDIARTTVGVDRVVNAIQIITASQAAYLDRREEPAPQSKAPERRAP